MIRYFFGEDVLTTRGRITALAQSLQAQLRFVDESNILSSSLEVIVDQAKGSLFGKALLIFRDPLSYHQDIRDQLVEYVESSHSGEIIFWERGNPDARSSLHKLFKKSAEVEQFQNITDIQQGLKWITKYISEHRDNTDTMISRDAAMLLLQRVGFDTFSLASEIQKLLAYHIPISREDVENIVPERALDAVSAFPLLDAISVKNSKAAIALLVRMIAGGASERFILSMIAYQYRLLLAVRIGLDERMDSMQIAKLSKLHPIAIQKTIPLAKRFSLSAIHDALLRIAGTERSMNTNKTMDDRSIVTMLVSSLTA
ncbi:MAG TPA: hypothetical protein VLG69_05210 [Candidatus Andersenbacteria bacterium]|nr:hypothetical protein [Candidatus Andersenbacteria bacterium]